ncbi:MAG: copper chaperone PCu(A)C [Hyphomicrobiaceae bacterium]
MRRFWSVNIVEIVVAAALTLGALAIVAVRLTNAVEPQAAAIAPIDAWARPMIGGSATSAVYLKIRNTTGEDDRLVSVKTPVSEKAEIHVSRNENGIMRMRRLGEGVPVLAGEMVSLEPGGRHVMLIGVQEPLVKGETFPLTLTFEKAGEIEIPVAINIMPPSQAKKRGSH